MDSITKGNVEEKHSPIFWAVLGITTLALTFGLVIYVTQAQKPRITPTVEGAIREGAEFDDAASKISVEWDNDRTTESPTTMGTVQMTIGGIARNFTGQTIKGLEVGCAVVDFSGATVKQRSFALIPNKQPTLENNKTVEFTMIMDGFKKDDDRANIKCRPVAIKF